jgi:hypothetical protein
VRLEIIDQLLNRIISKSSSNVSGCIKLLSMCVAIPLGAVVTINRLVRDGAHLLRDSIPKLRESIDFLSYMPSSVAGSFVKVRWICDSNITTHKQGNLSIVAAE